MDAELGGEGEEQWMNEGEVPALTEWSSDG